jgi:hypothetical protein
MPLEAVVEQAIKPFDGALWRDLAELGVLSLRTRENDGGLGLGMAEAVLVFAELGRRLLPGPLIWSALIAGLLPEVGEGGLVVTGLDQTRSASGPLMIEHWEGSNTLIVLDSEGVRRIETDALQARAVETPLDPLTPVHQVHELPPGERLADSARGRYSRQRNSSASRWPRSNTRPPMVSNVSNSTDRSVLSRPSSTCWRICSSEKNKRWLRFTRLLPPWMAVASMTHSE